MPNSLYNQLTNTHQSGNSVIDMLKNSANPEQLLWNMASRDSRVANVLKEVQANNGDAKGLFLRKAQELGINPSVILSQLK